MKRTWVSLAVVGAVAMILTGCDWTSGGGATSWNEAYNWVNFSGVYRGLNGGVLITDYTVTPGTAGATNTVTNERIGTTGGNTHSQTFSSPNGMTATVTVQNRPIVPGSVRVTAGGNLTFVDDGSGNLAGQPIGSGNVNYGTGVIQLDFQQIVNSSIVVSYTAQAPTASGVLNRRPVVEGSLTIRAGGVVLTDDGAGALAGGGATGTITYGTGAWSVDFGATTVSGGQAITASYQFFVSGTDPATGPGSGTTGRPIYSFTVFQEGNLLRITDNNGATYEGNFGSVRTTGGADQNNPNPASGDQIIAQYTARGTSAAGLTISIAGTFQGVVSGGGASFSLSDRRMYGTWIEDGGRNGDVNGQASPISIVTPETGGGQ